MSGCVGCHCTRPAAPARGRLLLATRVAHTLAALRSAIREAGGTCRERAPGLLEACGPDSATLLAGARKALSPVEAQEVRAIELDGVEGDLLTAAALTAPTLAELDGRARHADLLPLFADELDTFRSVYQPIVALGAEGESTGVVGYEALLRATTADGPIPPAALFAAAEEAGWLHVLDRVGRTTALRGAKGWLGDALLFVNFLPTTIYRPQVCLQTTERAARDAGLRLDQLVFEVTESERVKDMAHLADVFAYYRERGCKVALDDLGAGYSSLNMLVQLQPDVVKLDKDIVQRLPTTVSNAVVKAVVEITHAYGGLVLAECVETADQARAARDLGVDLGQGWHFGRPEEVAQRHAPAAAAPVPSVPPRSASPAGTRPWLAFSGDDDAVALGPDSPPEHRDDDSAAAAGRGLADVEALLGRALEVSSTCVTITDASSVDLPLIYVNAAFERTTGYRASDVLGKNCRFLQGPDTDPQALVEMRQAIREGREHVAVVRNYTRDGQPWWNELRLSPVQDQQGRVTHYFGFQNDVTARVQAEQEVHRLAYFDALTGLPNRAHLLQLLQREVDRSVGGGHRFAVLFIDLDGFKAVNDRYGHIVGDLTLAAAAACLRGAVREGDLLARYSGDEFVAVLSDVAPDGILSIAQRTADAVVDSLTTPLQAAGRAVPLGASIGVALFPEHGRTVEELLQVADRTMYAAKKAGRGRALLAGRA